MLKPVIVYFRLGFWAEFVLGTVRVLLVVPLIGDRAAKLLAHIIPDGSSRNRQDARRNGHACQPDSSRRIPHRQVRLAAASTGGGRRLGR